MDQLLTVVTAENGIRISPLPMFHSRRVALPTIPANRPEFTLLLTIARVELPTAEQSQLQELLAQALDWEYLLAMAELHGLEPLLLHHLHDAAAGLVPQKAMQTLHDNCRAIALRNLLLSAKLREISAHLTSLQVEHIAYKGPLLAEIYGGNGALRAYRDLDFLVHQENLEFVRDALREIGFNDKYGFTTSQQAAAFRSGFEHSFTSKSGIDLDVHWRVVQEFKSRALDMDGMWKRKTMDSLMDQDVPALSPEDLLVVLCLHAGHHGWMQLSHMCDLVQLFRVHGEFDWEIVLGHLGDSNTLRIVCISLYLLQKNWHIDLPEEIAALISADPYVECLVHRIKAEIWPAARPALTTSSLRWLLTRTAGEDLGDRARLLAGSIFVPSIEDFAQFRLPAMLSLIYGGLRMFRLVCKCVSTQWRRWGQREALQRIA